MEGGIDTVSSVIGGIGAILCALLGTISNGLTMWVILKRSKIRGHLTSPLLFLMCLSNFVFSLVGLPIKVEWATGSPLHQKLENLTRNFSQELGPPDSQEIPSNFSKGQKISKANYGALNSSKKRTKNYNSEHLL